ncbi:MULTISPECIES: murein hydrolase activator EnvC family protein [unclassified Streptomyces]|uniref:murein hydrolase activator EnvC family protein n=1 Tax=unclassified Streptomyces TaxID=2593676 RepID=UPI0022B6D34E|nr:MULTISPECIES: M23 family metallopeptidase [unclassified Streptomyces]MCZ7414426.1 M23 family metallopeptidase [Streptomyces sp. WMMC897]MCZ7431381.1 M23 family metallopeptidase [Streptomyces sp. WMMC1477]
MPGTSGTRFARLTSRRAVLRGGMLTALGCVPALGAVRLASAEESPESLRAAGRPWARPLAGHHRVSAHYGIPGDWLAGHHTGIDFAVDSGTPVHAVGTGTIDSAGALGDYGQAVVLRLADGHFALYAHLSRIDVRAGQRVAGGEDLAHTGATGRVTGPHLHFEIRTTRDYGTDVDPVRYLADRGVSIL